MAMLQLLNHQCGSSTTNATKAIGADCFEKRHLIKEKKKLIKTVP